MEFNRWICTLFCFLFMGFAVAAPSFFISDGVFESQAYTGRSLLQTKKACPVNFEFLNYTIITSQCKGPTYPPGRCCSSFKEFACPYAEELNDLTNDCAATMFSYINLYGKYPPGLFASECKEGKLGLACPATPPSTSATLSGSKITCRPPHAMLAAGFLLLLLRLL